MARTVGFFTDTTLCIGCKACEVACKEWNQLPGHAPRFGDGYDNTGQLDEQNWRHVQFHERTTAEGRGGLEHDERRLQALRAWRAAWRCVRPTPSSGRSSTPSTSSPSVCNGCRDCIAACPYHVIGFDEQSGLARKCTFCYDRLQANLTPACAKACPTESIKFGELSAMRDVAAARLNQLRGQGMSEARLYGDKEYGGLHALFLLTDKPEAYGLPERGERGAAEPQQRPRLPRLAGRRRCSASSARSSRSASAAGRSSAMPQHFVAPPQWEWYIVWYFFLGGHRRRRVPARDAPPAVRRPPRRRGRAARLPGQLPRDGHLPDLADARPRAAGSLLAHADRQPDVRAQLQVLVSDVGRGLGAPHLRRVLPPCPSWRRCGGAGGSPGG